jgi:hypothetical protein
MAEYPNLNMVGEEWSKLPAVVSHWQRGKVNFNGYVSSMPSMMDFPLTEAMRTRAGRQQNNGTGSTTSTRRCRRTTCIRIGRLVLFEGNHDMARIYSVVARTSTATRWTSPS